MVLSGRIAAALIIFAACASAGRGADTTDVPSVIVPFVTKHCVGCHGADDPEGGLSLQGFTTDASILKSHRAWTNVLEKVGSGEMPPRDEPRPAADDVVRFTAAVKEVFARYVRSGTRDPGRVVMRRLSRYEYQATVRDLLGVMIPFGDRLPPDNVSEGFDNIADSLEISPVHMDAFIEASDLIMQQAIVAEPLMSGTQHVAGIHLRPASTGKDLDPQGRRSRDGDGKPIDIKDRLPPLPDGARLVSRPEPLRWTPDTKILGEYRIVARLQGYRVTTGTPSFALLVNGTSVLHGTCGEAAEDHVATVTLTPGPVRVQLQVSVHDAAATESADPAARDGVVVHHLNLIGPPRPFLQADLLAAPEGLSPEEKSRHVVERFARRAYRRPPQAAEVDRLLAIVRAEEQTPRYRFQDAEWKKLAAAKALPDDVLKDLRSLARESRTFVKEADFISHVQRVIGLERSAAHGATILEHAEVGRTPWETAVAKGMQAAICSPRFLFRVEPAEPSAAVESQPIDDHALASRLSYFLWSSMPDDELFALAEKKQLRQALPAQVRRMLADPRSQGLVENFVAQWLKLDTLSNFEADPETFPRFKITDARYRNQWHDLRDSMRAETLLFARAVIRDDSSIFTLLDGDFSFLDRRLAEHYNIRDTKGNPLRDPAGKPAGPPADPGGPIPEDDFVRVAVGPAGRGGLLTHASVLTLTSTAKRTSPVKRGAWVLDRILGTPPPPPPPDVPALEEKPAEAGQPVAMSARQLLEQHRARADCAACHARIDPIGFAFEHYDSIGQFRVTIGTEPVDARGVLPDGTAIDGVAGLKKILLQRRPVFARSLAEKMLTYAIGRRLEFHDLPAVEEIMSRAEEQGYRAHALITAVVQSDPFLMRRPSTDKETNP